MLLHNVLPFKQLLAVLKVLNKPIFIHLHVLATIHVDSGGTPFGVLKIDLKRISHWNSLVNESEKLKMATGAGLVIFGLGI